jgi:hypothetical protein
MAKFTPENLTAFLEFISKKPNLAAAARSIGISEAAVFNWLHRSAADQKAANIDSPFRLSWPEGSEPAYFHELIGRARARYKLLFEAQLRDEVTNGIPRVQTRDGQVVYQLDPQFVGWSDKDMEALGFDLSERYLRDSKGNAIPLVLNESAPAHLKIHVSRALLPEYADKRSVEFHGTMQSAVRVISDRPAPIRALPAPPQQETAPEQTPKTLEPPKTELAAALEKLDQLERERGGQTDFTRDMRRLLIERAAKPTLPTHPVHVGAPSLVHRQVPLMTPQAGVPYRSPEARAEGIGDGAGVRDAMAAKGGYLVAADHPQPKLSDAEVERRLPAYKG